MILVLFVLNSFIEICIKQDKKNTKASANQHTVKQGQCDEQHATYLTVFYNILDN